MRDWILPASPWLARIGLLRAGRVLSSRADGLAAGGALRAFLNRPDHLSRAAAELDGWDETVKRASESSLAPGTEVVTVDLRHHERIAFLTNPHAVEQVVRAIAGAVKNARRRE